MNDHNPFIPLVSRQRIYGAISLASPYFRRICDSCLPSLFFSPLLLLITPPITYQICDNLCFYVPRLVVSGERRLYFYTLPMKDSLLSPAAQDRKEKTSPAFFPQTRKPPALIHPAIEPTPPLRVSAPRGGLFTSLTWSPRHSSEDWNSNYPETTSVLVIISTAT